MAWINELEAMAKWTSFEGTNFSEMSQEVREAYASLLDDSEFPWMTIEDFGTPEAKADMERKLDLERCENYLRGRYGREITHSDQVPEEDLSSLYDRVFNGGHGDNMADAKEGRGIHSKEYNTPEKISEMRSRLGSLFLN